MSRNNAAKRLFSTLARQAEAQASGLQALGQMLLAQRTTTKMLGGATARVRAWVGGDYWDALLTCWITSHKLIVKLHAPHTGQMHL